MCTPEVVQVLGPCNPCRWHPAGARRWRCSRCPFSNSSFGTNVFPNLWSIIGQSICNPLACLYMVLRTMIQADIHEIISPQLPRCVQSAIDLSFNGQYLTMSTPTGTLKSIPQFPENRKKVNSATRQTNKKRHFWVLSPQENTGLAPLTFGRIIG